MVILLLCNQRGIRPIKERPAHVSSGVYQHAVELEELFLAFSLYLLSANSLLAHSIYSSIDSLIHQTDLGVYHLLGTKDAKMYDITPTLERLDSARICTDVLC